MRLTKLNQTTVIVVAILSIFPIVVAIWRIFNT